MHSISFRAGPPARGFGDEFRAVRRLKDCCALTSPEHRYRDVAMLTSECLLSAGCVVCRRDRARCQLPGGSGGVAVSQFAFNSQAQGVRLQLPGSAGASKVAPQLPQLGSGSLKLCTATLPVFALHGQAHPQTFYLRPQSAFPCQAQLLSSWPREADVPDSPH